MQRSLEELVWSRAKGCCEYCQMPHQYDALPFEVDHIIAVKHGGDTVARNLALACFWCNRFKGTDFATLDPRTRKRIFLFNPRRHRWHRHFRWDGARLIGRTPVGRATIALLKINHPLGIQARDELIDEGVFPPPEI
jgi:hypothetical protein